MEKIWKALAEIAVEPGDTTSDNTVGFTWVTMWATSREELATKLEGFLEKYRWKLLSLDETQVVDPSARVPHPCGFRKGGAFPMLRRACSESLTKIPTL